MLSEDTQSAGTCVLLRTVGQIIADIVLIVKLLPQHGHKSSLGMIATALDGAAVAAIRTEVTTATIKTSRLLQE